MESSVLKHFQFFQPLTEYSARETDDFYTNNLFWKCRNHFFILLLHQMSKNDAKKAKLGSEIQMKTNVIHHFKTYATSVVAGTSWN